MEFERLMDFICEVLESKDVLNGNKRQAEIDAAFCYLPGSIPETKNHGVQEL